MRSTSRFILAAAAAAAVALAIVAVPVLLRDPDDAAPAPSPATGITAKAVEITSAPQVSSELRGAATEDIEAALAGLYREAFVQPQTTEGPAGSPPPRPAARIGDRLTTIARRALAKTPEVFDEASDLSVHTGRVTFTGVITFDGDRPLEALLEIDFLGDGTPAGLSSPQVRLHQVGTMVLKNTEGGWLVDGFDLRFATRPLTSPTPSP